MGKQYYGYTGADDDDDDDDDMMMMMKFATILITLRMHDENATNNVNFFNKNHT